jgi:dCMP deaminase
MPENPPRLEFLEYGALMAFAASCRSTCRRRLVGAALFDSHKVVKATGYNGAPAGAPQCDEIGCLMVDGHCKRIAHAERNAVIFSGNADLRGGYSFITIMPCRSCFDLLVAKEVKYLYYLEDYRNEEHQEYVKKVCGEKGMTLQKITSCVVALMQKAIDFHQGSGGLLIAKNKLRILEDIPEIMDH